MKKQLLQITLVGFFTMLIVNSPLHAADGPKGNLKSEAKMAVYKQVKIEKESPKKIKKLTFKEKFKLIKQFRKEKRKLRKMGVKSDAPMIILYILAVLLPPVAVGIYTDWEAKPTLIDLLLTLLFWLPGIVYAFYILLS